jgi:hypothetical protein
MVETETVSETLNITSILTWRSEPHTEILLKKVLAVYLVKKFSIFTEAERSLPC